MNRLQLFSSRILMGWGLFCSGIIVVFSIAIAYQYGPGKSSDRTASAHDI